MPKKECRYNPKHKFDTEQAQLDHESKCPDKKKRTDLKECPYTNRHIVTIRQYENHIKKCKFKPKVVKKEEKINNDKNKNNKDTNKENKNNDAKFKWDGDKEFWGDDADKNDDTNSKENEIKKKIFNFDEKDINNGDVFEEDDFIFKQCYI